MHVRIYQARANHIPPDVQLLGISRGFGTGIHPDRRDLPLANQHVGAGIKAVGGVYDPPASEKQ